MNRSTFDTLTAARELQAAGMQDDQAEAVVTAISHARSDQVTAGDLAATAADFRADLAATAADLRADLADTAADFRADLAGLETRIARAMLVQSGVTIAATVGLLSLVITLAGGA